jgi:hypothetical protein
VLTNTDREFGTVHHVLQVPELDLFDGISVQTHNGLRFVDRDQITDITTRRVRTELSDRDVEALPPPEGTVAIEPDMDYEGSGGLTAHLGRLFGRPHWKNIDP